MKYKSQRICVLKRYFYSNNRSKTIMEGPTLPKQLFNPCVVEAPSLNTTFIFGHPLNETVTPAYLYNFFDDTWLDISSGNPCQTEFKYSYSCARDVRYIDIVSLSRYFWVKISYRDAIFFGDIL